jgi:pimeloyl-ACP methyl ester carboxylesterase
VCCVARRAGVLAKRNKIVVPEGERDMKKILPAMKKCFQALAYLALLSCALVAATAMAQSEPIGVVIMHGKGGSPTGLVADLASSLEKKGFLVANLDMPWSEKRNYDVTAEQGEQEVETALAGLRKNGAKNVFVIGHSQGGVFALHLAGKIAADGFVTIAPGGSTANRYFYERISDSLARAKELVAAGKGNEPAELYDYENARGNYPVKSTPAVYVTWFDPAGAMSEERAVKVVNPRVPVLWVGPTRDYPGLLKFSLPLYRELPKHPLTRLYEPNADHRGAPAAAADEIARWTREVASTGGGK